MVPRLPSRPLRQPSPPPLGHRTPARASCVPSHQNQRLPFFRTPSFRSALPPPSSLPHPTPRWYPPTPLPIPHMETLTLLFWFPMVPRLTSGPLRPPFPPPLGHRTPARASCVPSHNNHITITHIIIGRMATTLLCTASRGPQLAPSPTKYCASARAQLITFRGPLGQQFPLPLGPRTPARTTCLRLHHNQRLPFFQHPLFLERPPPLFVAPASHTQVMHTRLPIPHLKILALLFWFPTVPRLTSGPLGQQFPLPLGPRTHARTTCLPLHNNHI